MNCRVRIHLPNLHTCKSKKKPLQTRIFVTHGLKYLKEFDMIVVLSGGRISEVGTYEQLLANNSHFADFLRQHIEEESQEDVEMNEEGG